MCQAIFRQSGKKSFLGKQVSGHAFYACRKCFKTSWAFSPCNVKIFDRNVFFLLSNWRHWRADASPLSPPKGMQGI